MSAEFLIPASRFLDAYRRPVLGLVTIAVLWVVSQVTMRTARRYLEKKAYKKENVQNFIFVLRYVWFGVIVVFALVSFSGSLAAMGISAAFLGMIMGWSLQAPVTGIAAWLMIVLKRPFKIGDRVIINGVIGDVTDITLTHVVLNQVGGTVGGEEKSGRGVLIPNAILFQQTILNYAYESQYILDEVVVMVTYGSDADSAEKILLAVAKSVTEKIIDHTRKQPFVRLELADSGIRLRLRYQTLAVERQRISSEIVREIIRAFGASDKVEFCYPHTEILYRPKELHPPPNA